MLKEPCVEAHYLPCKTVGYWLCAKHFPFERSKIAPDWFRLANYITNPVALWGQNKDTQRVWTNDEFAVLCGLYCFSCIWLLYSFIFIQEYRITNKALWKYNYNYKFCQLGFQIEKKKVDAHKRYLTIYTYIHFLYSYPIRVSGNKKKDMLLAQPNQRYLV